MLDYPFPVVNAIVAIAAFAVSIAVLWLLLRTPVRGRLVAVPSDERWHEQPTPMFGGVGIFAGFAAGVGVALAAGVIDWSNELGGILAGVTIVFLAGLVDDLRHLSPIAKLAAQITAAVIVGLMTTYEGLLDHNLSHTWMLFPFGWSRYGDWPDLAACRAPTPLLVQYDEDDHLFSETGMRAADARLAAHYAGVGRPENYVGQFYTGPHKFDLEMQGAAFAWLEQRLIHNPIAD